MATTFLPVYANYVDSMESRKRKGDRVPLPYLIRPRKQLPLYDSFCFYNDYVESSSDNDGLSVENDEDEDLPMEAVETSSMEKDNCFDLQKEINASLSETGESSDHSLSDEEYVLVSSSKAEKEGVIQMMELLKDLPVLPLPSDEVLEKDTVNQSEPKDSGSDSDGWLFV